MYNGTTLPILGKKKRRMTFCCVMRDGERGVGQATTKPHQGHARYTRDPQRPTNLIETADTSHHSMTSNLQAS